MNALAVATSAATFAGLIAACIVAVMAALDRRAGRSPRRALLALAFALSVTIVGGVATIGLDRQIHAVSDVTDLGPFGNAVALVMFSGALLTVLILITVVGAGVAALVAPIVHRPRRKPLWVLRLMAGALLPAVIVVGALAIYVGNHDQPPPWTLTADAELTISPQPTVDSGRLLFLHPSQRLTDPAYALFSDDQGARTVVPAFTTGAGEAATVAPLVLAETPDRLRVQLLLGSGTRWRASNRVDVTIHPSGAVEHTGAPTLFLIDVGRALLAESGRRATVAAAVAPEAANAYQAVAGADALFLQSISDWLALVVDHGYLPFAIGNTAVTANDLASVDRMVAANLLAIGPASPSPCGEAKDKAAAEILGTGVLTSDDVLTRAYTFTSALLDCPLPEMHDVSQRIIAGLTPGVLEIDRIRSIGGALLGQSVVLGYGDGYATAVEWEDTLRRQFPASVPTGPENEEWNFQRDRLRAAQAALLAEQQHALEADGADFVAARESVSRLTALFKAARKLEQGRASQLANDLRCGGRVDCDPNSDRPIPVSLPRVTHQPSAVGQSGAAPPTATAAVRGAAGTPGGATPTPGGTTATLVPVTPRPSGSRIQFVPAQPPEGKEGQDYPRFTFCVPPPTNFALGACGPGTSNPSGGQGPYHFQLDSGVGFPPIGMSLGKDGQLSGKPGADTGGRTYTFRVCAVDLSGDQACGNVTLTVATPPRGTLTVASVTRDLRYPQNRRYTITGTASGPVGTRLSGLRGLGSSCSSWGTVLFGNCQRQAGDPESTDFTIVVDFTTIDPGNTLKIDLDGTTIASQQITYP